jgi:TonB family protein
VILRLGGVMLSVVLHVGLIALLLAWSATDWTRPVFVDLGEPADSSGSPSADPAPARSARPAARAAGPTPAPARAPAGLEPVEPAAPSAPAPAPAPLPAEPVAPVAPPAPAIAVEPVPAPPAAPSVSSVASAPAEGRGGPSDGGSGAGGRSGGQTRGDADRGSGGGAPGSPLALATPGAGGSGAPPPEYGPYLRRFRQRVEESLIYPLAARRQGLGGTVELHVWLEATGRVRDVQVARSSSHGVLDDAAVETIRRLGPMPFPDSLPRRPLLIRLPLVYELR